MSKNSPAEAAWRADFYRKFSRLEQQFGRGETYSAHARKLILDKVVPEWLFRGVLTAETAEHVERCQKGILALERLHTEIFGNQKNDNQPEDE
jgi:hypothetical protein